MAGFVAGLGAGLNLEELAAPRSATCRRTLVKSATRNSKLLRMAAFEEDSSGSELTVGEAVRSWQTAKDNGQVPEEAPEVNATQDNKFKILFVDRDNASTSVVAEAILADLITRREYGSYLSTDSAGYRVSEGTKPPSDFVQALGFRRKLDIAGHAARKLSPQDIDNYHLIICMDSKTKNNVIYMKIGNPGQGKDPEKEKMILRKVKLLSEYCTVDKLKKAEFPSGEYRQQAMRMMLSTVVDGCNGLIARLSKGVEKNRKREKNSG